MPIGITNATIITEANITSIANATGVPNLFININNTIYSGYLFFVLLWVLWIILFVAAQNKENQILTNAMYSGAIVTVVSLFLRAIEIVDVGLPQGLLNDFQMWMFPLITILLATVLWLTKRA